VEEVKGLVMTNNTTMRRLGDRRKRRLPFNFSRIEGKQGAIFVSCELKMKLEIAFVEGLICYRNPRLRNDTN
jgi:hypothetical protein